MKKIPKKWVVSLTCDHADDLVDGMLYYKCHMSRVVRRCACARVSANCTISWIRDYKIYRWISFWVVMHGPVHASVADLSYCECRPVPLVGTMMVIRRGMWTMYQCLVIVWPSLKMNHLLQLKQRPPHTYYAVVHWLDLVAALALHSLCRPSWPRYCNWPLIVDWLRFLWPAVRIVQSSLVNTCLASYRVMVALERMLTFHGVDVAESLTCRLLSAVDRPFVLRNRWPMMSGYPVDCALLMMHPSEGIARHGNAPMIWDALLLLLLVAFCFLCDGKNRFFKLVLLMLQVFFFFW